MIDEDATQARFGYTSDRLKPKSHKLVVRLCDRCGREREVEYVACGDLCATCANKKRFEDPKEREKQRQNNLKRYEDPEEREKTSIAGKKAHKDDPTLSERISLGGKKSYQDDPTRASKHSVDMKKIHQDNPTISQNHSVDMKKLHQDNPSISQKHSVDMKKHYAEMDDPGQEIIMHHYIYDFNDLDKYRIPVTRSEHTTIHHNLRRAGLEVPCINIMKGD